jgi:hypothetical protein
MKRLTEVEKQKCFNGKDYWLFKKYNFVHQN